MEQDLVRLFIVFLSKRKQDLVFSEILVDFFKASFILFS